MAQPTTKQIGMFNPAGMCGLHVAPRIVRTRSRVGNAQVRTRGERSSQLIHLLGVVLVAPASAPRVVAPRDLRFTWDVGWGRNHLNSEGFIDSYPWLLRDQCPLKSSSSSCTDSCVKHEPRKGWPNGWVYDRKVVSDRSIVILRQRGSPKPVF